MLDLACCQASATSPLKTSLPTVRAKPLTSSTVVFGGTASARGSVTKSMSAGPGWAKARSIAGRMSAAFSTRSPWMPAAVASAPKSGFFTSVPQGW